MRSPTKTALSGPNSRANGYKVNEFGGLSTTMDPSNIGPNAASSMRNVLRENGSLRTRFGFRNVLPDRAGMTGNRGFHWCETYDAGTHYEGLVTFDLISGTLKPYEIALNFSDNEWYRWEIKKGASSLSLDTGYWRRVCFQDYVYFFNKDDASPVTRYKLGTHGSWEDVKPPASPSAAPRVTYYVAPGQLFLFPVYGATQASYANADITSPTGVVKAVAVGDTEYASGNIVAEISGQGEGSLKFGLVHNRVGQNLAYNDVFTCEFRIDAGTSLDVEWSTLKLTLWNTDGTSQDLVTEVIDVDRPIGTYIVALIGFSFSDKTRSSFESVKDAQLSFKFTAGAAGERLKIGGLVAGGVSGWGVGQEGDNAIGVEVAYSYYDSTTGFESGLSPVAAITTDRLLGFEAHGSGKNSKRFRMGSFPEIGGVSSSGADNIRVYLRYVLKNPVAGKNITDWKRFAEKADSSPTVNFATTRSDYNDLDAYTPAPFDYENVVAAFAYRNFVAWLYAGGTKNVRLTRSGSAVSQASPTDASDTPLNQDDPFRGANFTLSEKVQDEPVGGLALDRTMVILGKKQVYIMFDTTGLGLPSQFSPPRAIPNAPGCAGYECFALWHDDNGDPIVVYLTQDLQSIWAVKIPQGLDQGLDFSKIDYELGYMLRGGLPGHLYPTTFSPGRELLAVYVNRYDDSLHLRYHKNEIVLRRQDLNGQRHWEAHEWSVGYLGSQWHKFAVVESEDAGNTVFGVRLNGAVDEFERTFPRYPGALTTHVVEFEGQPVQPVSTDTGADTVSFIRQIGWGASTPFRVSENSGGLLVNTDYYAHKVDTQEYSVHLSAADAYAGANKVNLTSAVTCQFVPLGRDDGRPIDNEIYWQGRANLGARRRCARVHLQKSSESDTFDVTVSNEKGESVAVGIGEGSYNSAVPPSAIGHELTYRVTLSEGDSVLDGFWAEEHVLGQAVQS